MGETPIGYRGSKPIILGGIVSLLTFTVPPLYYFISFIPILAIIKLQFNVLFFYSYMQLAIFALLTKGNRFAITSAPFPFPSPTLPFSPLRAKKAGLAKGGVRGYSTKSSEGGAVPYSYPSPRAARPWVRTQGVLAYYIKMQI